LDSPASPAPESPYALSQARASAVLEIVLCSGVPSQLALAYMFALAGFTPLVEGGRLSFGYIATLLLLDAMLLVGLIVWLLLRNGENPKEVFLGVRPIGPEIRIGVPMTAAVFMIAIVVMTTSQILIPSLRNAQENPLQHLMSSPGQAVLLAVVGTISGGLREEIQRAFILHRFEQHLGGGAVGLVLYSLIFGLGHSLQGWAAVITTSILGLFWGYVYLSRRSIVAPVVSHSGFNAAQIVVFLVSRK
jgi:membrane protease YdiL (CAAX protease family)